MERKEKAKERNFHIGLAAAYMAAFVWSAVQPYDRQAWFLLSLPSVIVVAVLIATYKKFKFSSMVYLVVFIHMVILLVGAYYTYSRNPLFDMLIEEFGFRRNHFDRVGHLAQGFSPALMTKEILVRGGYIKKGKMMFLIVISMCLGFSSAYELIEFGTAKILGLPAEYIMGMQGDYWDSIWDMFYALIGSCTAVFVFGGLHDKAMEKLCR